MQPAEEKSVDKQITQANIKEQMEGLGVPLEVAISAELHDFLESAFSPHFERAFMLFAKDGFIQKAVESTYANSPRSFSFSTDQLLGTVRIMQNEGFEYVSTYHHHLDSDRQVGLRKAATDGYNLPQNYDPIQMSPDDRGGFNSIGLPYRDDQEIVNIKEGVKYLFLGHRGESQGFRMKSYTVLSQLPQDHPWNQDKQELQQDGYMQVHYRGFTDILDHPIEIVSTGNDDIEAIQLLNKHHARNRKYEQHIHDGTIRVFTDNDEVSMIELIRNGKAERYWFDTSGNIVRGIIYGDNTTSMEKRNLEDVPEERLPIIKQELYDQFGSLLQRNVA